MPRLLIALPVLVSLLPLVDRAVGQVPAKADGPFYYPVKVGWRNDYRVNADGSFFTLVTKVEKQGREWRVTEVSGLPGGDPDPESSRVIAVSSEGLVVLQEIGGQKPVPPLIPLRLPVGDGLLWERDDATRRTRLVATYAARHEAVETPAGRFHAVRVDRTSQWEADGKPKSAPRTTWFTPGVGEVKTVMPGYVRVLTSSGGSR